MTEYLHAEFCPHQNPVEGDGIHVAGEPSDLICLETPSPSAPAMSPSGKATGPALALCEAMGWEPDLGYSEGRIPKGGQIAVEVLAELQAAGWTLVPTRESTERWATAPDGEQFRVGACQGHSACQVEVHEHGCYADVGNCDHPDEHRSSDSPTHPLADHAFKPGRFGGGCQVMLARYPCPYPADAHPLPTVSEEDHG